MKLLGAAATLVALAYAAQAEIPVTVEVRVQGLETLDSLFVLRTAGLATGTTHSSIDLSEAVKRLYRAGLVDDVEVLETTSAVGRILTLVIKERPPLTAIGFTGNRHLKDEELEEKIPLIKGQRVNRARLESYAAMLTREYRDLGYLKAQIDVDTTVEDAGIAVTYRIDEGPKVTVRDIQILGTSAFPPSRVAKEMKLKPKGFLRSGKYDKEKLEESLDAIERFYRKRGYLDAAVTQHRLEYMADGKNVAVVIEVDEGRQFTVGTIAVDAEDSLAFVSEHLLSRLKLESGEAFDYEKFENGIRSIYEMFQEQGYLWARVIPVESRDSTRIDYTLDIRQGPPAVVRLINVEGNTRTKEKVIRRELLIYPGQRFRRSALVRSHREVYNLGFFEDVQVDFENPTTEGEVDFLVEVKEKSSGQFNFGITYSSMSRLMGFIQLAHPNVMGNAWHVNLRWEFGRYSKNIEFGFTEPWLLGTPTRAGFDVYSTSRNIYYADYREKRRGAGVHVGRPLPWLDYFSAYVAYSLHDVQVDPDNDYTGPELPTNWQTTSRTVWRLVRDSRDNFLDPREGSRTSLTFELAGGPFGGDIAYRKHEIQTSWLAALSQYLVLNTRVRLGSVAGFPDLEDVPIYEKFRPGGTSVDGVIRGYDDYSLGPVDATGYATGGRALATFAAELRIPVVPEQIDLLAFFDAGNAWRSIGEINLEEMKRGAGVGIRINTGIMGIIGLDYGYGFDRDQPGWKPHFQFGSFM
jgi:outer membrane protein insertion porin family